MPGPGSAPSTWQPPLVSTRTALLPAPLPVGFAAPLKVAKLSPVVPALAPGRVPPAGRTLSWILRDHRRKDNCIPDHWRPPINRDVLNTGLQAQLIRTRKCKENRTGYVHANRHLGMRALGGPWGHRPRRESDGEGSPWVRVGPRVQCLISCGIG